MQEKNNRITQKSLNYVLIDAALWENDINAAKQFDLNFRSLFRGRMGEELNSVAPFLFEVTKDAAGESFKHFLTIKNDKEPILRRVLWMQSSFTIDILRQHLRRFLRVKTSLGGYLYFRLYDPYVVNCVLPTLNKEQLGELFSKISFIVSEDIHLNEQRKFSVSDGGELMVTFF